NSVYDGKAHDLISSGSVDDAVGKIMFSLDNEKWSEAVPSMTSAGTYDVYYMIKGSDNYEDSEVSKKSATISKADFEVANNDQEYDYDGMAHGRGLSVTTVDQSTPSVTYSFEGSSYSEEVPSFTDVYVNFKGEVIIRKINYRIEAENFNTAEGSYTVLINRVDPTYVITYPELIYDGNMHKLIEASVEGGKILYSYTGIDRTFKDVVPYAKDAGEYTFYYRIDGDMNHNDIAKVQVSNTIRKAEIHVEVGNNTFAYNGQPQGEGISAYTDDDTDVVIRYGLSADKCWSSMVPKISNVDESRIIYYEVKAADHEPVTGSYMLEITPVAPEVTAPEKIEGLFYTGSYQNLITAGSSKDGTMMYKVDSEGSIGNYTTYIPTGKNAKEYTVSYYCAGDANHTDSEVGQLTVFIDMNNRVHLALSENEGEMEAGSEKDVEIDTNSNGTLSCESSSANVSCSIDDETKTLHIETAQEAVGEIVTITVRVTGGNYSDHSVTYTLTVKSKTGEEEVDVTPAEENSEENDEVTPAEGNDEEPKPEMANVSSAPDLVVQNESDEQSDKQEPVDKQPDIMEEINKVVIAEAKAEITSMQILSQYDMYGEPVSYFTRDGRLIKPQKDTPAGRYTVEVKVTLEFEVDEDGNTKIIMIDTASQEVSRQSDDSGSSKPAYVEVQDENKDEEEEIVVPEMINEQPVLPEVVQDENDNSDDDILNNNDLNPIYEPQNEPIINQEDGSDNENEETNETDITE
ncbi:MAG: hypothetical protein J6S49_08855, partial [Erysipelotrichaceae bacterium]|nr:hypothetical protein [Erysipelotrichaceae bacterium]